MQKLISIILLAVMAALNGCTQSTKTSIPNKPDPKDVKVADGCEGCHAVYESPVPFNELKEMVWLPDWNEKGTKIAVKGIVYKADGNPAPGVIIYIYHTDQSGRYTANQNETGWGKRHGSIRGWMKTNEKGEYKFYTLRPIPYPGGNIPAHIHATVKEPGKTEYWIEDFVFDDDILLTTAERNKMENRGGNGIVVFDENNKGKDIQNSSRNIYLGKNVPGYPSPRPSPVPKYRWTELTADAAFPKSYNFRLFSIRDTLWAFHSAGNWYSLDGKNWVKSNLFNSIGNLAFLDYVVFNNAVYGLGHFEGNIEKYDLTAPVYRSADLKRWTVLSENSNLPKRFFYHPFVFNDKIWIIGGGNGNTEFADIWNSNDAVHWVKQADNLPFGKRQGSQFVIFHNRIYMLNSDAWSSADGINWRKETPEIVKGESIFGYAPVVFDDKIWLLGCNRNGKFKSEMLVSSNGKDWTAQSAPWTPRGGIAATIYQGKIFMTGGKYGGPGIAGQTEFIYSNDVWSLEK